MVLLPELCSNVLLIVYGSFSVSVLLTFYFNCTVITMNSDFRALSLKLITPKPDPKKRLSAWITLMNYFSLNSMGSLRTGHRTSCNSNNNKKNTKQ